MAGNIKEVKVRINVEDKSIKDAKNSFDKLNNEISQQEGILGKLAKKEESLIKLRKRSSDPIAIKAYNKELDKTRTKMNQLQGATKKQTGMMSSMTKGIVQMGVQLAGAFAVKEIVANAIKSVVEFDKAIASLSAITGVTGKELDKLKGLVFQVAKETKKGSAEIAAAFELVGSKAPKLLENAEALAAVTKEAITLNKASGGELTESVGALTGVMNQFNLEADEASRIINVLAAGSQKGAAPVADIAQAIDKFGTVAAAANVSVEASVGLVETLAEKNINASEAGTQLRNIILKLQAANLGYTDGVFNLNDALKEVADKNLTAAESAKLFGLESVTAANILTTNITTLDSYTEAVTGTNTAQEQAAINSETLAVKTEELKKQWENLIVSMDDSSSVIGGTSKAFLGFISDALTGLQNLDLIWKDTMQGLSSFTEEELGRTLDGAWTTEFGKNITEITDKFDKIPFDTLEKNVSKLEGAWTTLLGEDKQEALLLFNKYINDRIVKERELIASTKDLRTEEEKAADAKAKEIEQLVAEGQAKAAAEKQAEENHAKRLERLKKESAARMAMHKATAKDNLESDQADITANDEFLAEFGLSDEQLDLLKSQREKRNEDEAAAEQERWENKIDASEAWLDFESEVADRKSQLDLQIASSAVNLANVLVSSMGGSAEAQVALIVLMKAIEAGQVIAKTQAANAVIFAEGAALAIPSAGASTAAAAGLITANNISAGLSLATIAATAIPQIGNALKKPAFKDGVIDLQGAGTGTSDSIHARLSKGESVMTAKETQEHKPLLKAIRNNELENYLNRVTVEKFFAGKREQAVQVSVNQNEKEINFPDLMSIRNAGAISKPIVDAMEESNFLNQNSKWE